MYLSGERGMLDWSGRWVVFLDLMLQIQVLGHSGSLLRLPTRITKLEVNPVVHNNYVQPLGEKQGLCCNKNVCCISFQLDVGIVSKKVISHKNELF